MRFNTQRSDSTQASLDIQLQLGEAAMGSADREASESLC